MKKGDESVEYALVCETPVGPVCIRAAGKAITALSFGADSYGAEVRETPLLAKAREQLEAYFSRLTCRSNRKGRRFKKTYIVRFAASLTAARARTGKLPQRWEIRARRARSAWRITTIRLRFSFRATA